MKFLTSLALGLIATAGIAFWLMIGVGVVHSEWLTGVPTLAYWDAFLITIPFEFVISIKRVEQKANDELLDGGRWFR